MSRPEIMEVKALENYKLYIKFSNNEEKIFDVKDYIRGNFYGQLIDKSIFNSVYLDDYNIICWSNGCDICPDETYYRSKPIKKDVINV